MANRVLNGCTLCNCIFVEKVDEMIDNLVPYSTILKFLKEKGIDLSKQSISRHKKHMGEKNIPKKKVSKGKIRGAQQKAKAKGGKSKSSLVKESYEDMVTIDNPNIPAKAKKSTDDRLQELTKQLEEDCDVIGELRSLIAIHKRRVEQARAEEEDSQLVLATTDNAMKGYQQALKYYHEITEGMESLQQLRYAQLVNMIGHVFHQQEISDRTRFELKTLIEYNMNRKKDAMEDVDSNEELDISIIDE